MDVASKRAFEATVLGSYGAKASQTSFERPNFFPLCSASWSRKMKVVHRLNPALYMSLIHVHRSSAGAIEIQQKGPFTMGVAPYLEKPKAHLSMMHLLHYVRGKERNCGHDGVCCARYHDKTQIQRTGSLHSLKLLCAVPYDLQLLNNKQIPRQA